MPLQLYDRELLAVYESVKHFRFMLGDRHFKVYKDHKPLIYAFKHGDRQGSPRQFNQLDFIAQFTTEFEHISGKDNVTADAAIEPKPETIAKAQERTKSCINSLKVGLLR